MSVTRRTFLQWLGLAPAVAVGTGYSIHRAMPIEDMVDRRVHLKDLQTLEARCTLTLDGKDLPYSQVRRMYVGENKFQFNGKIGRVTGYRLENGMGKISGEEFRDPIVASHPSDTLTIIIKGV